MTFSVNGREKPGSFLRETMCWHFISQGLYFDLSRQRGKEQITEGMTLT